jgi:3',5'-cyclic AMP phosphodiesterase CpdA
MILVSDLHFGACTQEAKEALMAAILADPDGLVIISGDITLNSKKEEFEEAQDFMSVLLAKDITVVSIDQPSLLYQHRS